MPARLRTWTAGLYAFGFLAILAPITFALLPLDRKQRLHDRLSIWWAKGILWIGGVRVQCEGLENVTPGERYLVAANHQSLLDIMAVVVALQPKTPIRFIAKVANFRLPILGWAMSKFGHIGVDPRSARGSLAGLHAAEAALSQRWSLIFFPEGTRTPDGRIGRFKTAPFRVAQRARVRILPVSISGGYQAMSRHDRAVVPGSILELCVHAPIDPPNEERRTSEVAAECQHIVESALPAASRSAESP